MDDGFVFLGSRLGNSLLLYYTEARSESASSASVGITEPASKRKRLNTAAEWRGTDGNDVEDLEMYGRDTVTSEPLSSYNFQVCDSILNIGPCGGAELGEPAFLSEEFVSQHESDLELVVLSGHGKNGALSILQRTVKPQVVTTFELPGCHDMWTVRTKAKQTPDKEFTDQHGYLVLSKEDATLILETGKEIMEVEESGYNTRQATVFVGNIGGDRNLILQVCSDGICLMDGVELLQQTPIDLGSPIVLCSLADPYAMLLTADGQFVMLTLEENEGSDGVQIHCTNPSLTQVPQVRCVCLYRDKSGMFVANESQPPKPAPPSNELLSDDDFSFKEKWNFSQKDESNSQKLMEGKTFTADEEDELLYGESDPDIIFTPSTAPKVTPSVSETTTENATRIRESTEQTYWAVVVRENGCLEVYDMPHLNLVYVVKNFTVGQKLLVGTSASHTFSGDSERTSTSDSRFSDNPQIYELLLVGLGYKGSRPHLLARIDEELLVYEAFKFKSSEKNIRKNSLQLRFKKVNHNIMMRRIPGTHDMTSEQSYSKRYKRLRPFDNIGGYTGVFLSGPYPHWIVSGFRGALRCHPMLVDGSVSCFVPFHNVNCPNGFLYFNQQEELRICMLPSHMTYDNAWPVRKVFLRSTPHFLTYSIEHKVYALVTSVSEPCTRLPYLNCDNEREYEDLERDDRFVYPSIDKFSVQLISPIGWELIPNARIDMDEFEHVTCMKNVWLSHGSDSSMRQNYVVIGTCNVMGEEMSSRGKIIILEVIEVVPEPGQPLTRNKLKKLYSEEQKGPVTAVCGVEGSLLAAIGQKVFIWKFDDNQSLKGLAFVDTNVYIHHAFSFRSFAVVADIQRSISLLRYQEDFKTLSVTSRDIRPLEVYTADLLVDGNTVGFITSDQDKNLVLFIYDPESLESNGGSRLIRRADIHIGAHVNCMWRIGACLFDRASGSANEPYAGAHVTMMATLDGGISNVLPITEKIYRRFLMLQNAMVGGLQHIAGLNPKGFRHIRSQQRALINPMKNILDGDLLWKFKNLSHLERHELSKKIGTTPEQILDDLMDIYRATCVM
ncbi:unnamed protein product [Clavelina lepadiformis]|uniref:Cleavage and polyadenylation specificity factor subunit 1 n=1 Tax=Clavelina lepadiformis TaxID=159417 RepID=A0ABP0F911_CLALP